jgi:flagellar basal-body rod protein FlgB
MNSNFTAMPLKVNHNQSFMEMSDFKPQTIESDENPPNVNGNTVNIEQEMSSLTKNGMTYNALATLQSKEFRLLADVIRGQ